MRIYRQGDVLLRATTEAPKGRRVARSQGKLVLAEGEVTGHSHTIASKRAQLRGPERDRYLVAEESVALEHQEHATIVLEPGVYKVIQQREYRPRGLSRLVAD